MNGVRALWGSPRPSPNLVGPSALCLLTFFMFAMPGGVRGQASPPLAAPLLLPGVTGYDASIPSPEALLGGEVGTRHLRPDELVTYLRQVAAASPRVLMGEHGLTYQGRPLVHAIISSPENLTRLEEIRMANLRLSDVPQQISDGELDVMPLVAYMGYSVHGNEASGSDASSLVLHHLAAGEGPAVEEVLRNVVVILDPSINPDGRARFVEWVTGNRGRVATSDPADREHNEPWPGGRTNHYLFDLNRDWLPAAHPESRGRLELFHRWRPQLHTDFHEMGGDASFFFQPGVPSRNNPNTPLSTVELTGRVGEYHARALDRIGQLYYSREQFDDFYYGKGSTYPDVNGAVGILFEQASSRSLLAETSRGLLPYAFTVRNQFVASLSTLEAGVALRLELLANHRDQYLGASAFAQAQPVRGWVLSLEEDRTRAQALIQMLQRHRIRVHSLATEVAGPTGTFRPGEAVVVPLDQPQARLVNGIMERRTTFQDSLFYDVSTWTASLAYGVRDLEVTQDPSGLLGAPLAERVELDGGAVVGGRAEYAYLLPPHHYFSHRALHTLQSRGAQTLVATRPFQAQVQGTPHDFPRGTVVIPVKGRVETLASRPDSIHAWVAEVARLDHVRIYSVGTGLNAVEPDLGSPGVVPIHQPQVALLAGSGTNSGMVGETWHLMNERMGIPVSLLDLGSVGGADLSRYNTVVVAGSASPGAGETEALLEWVRQGGRIITLGPAVNWALRAGLLEGELRSPPELEGPVLWEDVSTRSGARTVGGTIFRVVLDSTHPVAYGYGDEVSVFRNHNTFVEPPSALGTVVGRYADAPLLSGYLHAEVESTVAGSASILARRVGRGAAIALLDNPNFRAFWYGTNGLFLNAVFFGGVL
ncbi:MAG: M14 family metallopeptidase [Gemmatimonadota bacterium]